MTCRTRTGLVSADTLAPLACFTDAV
jgi:hypothetical protein